MSASFTYTTLRDAIQDWAEDDSTEFTDALDTLIALAESRLARDLNLDLFRTSDTGTMVQGTATLTRPSTLLTIDAVHYTSGSEKVFLTERSQDWCDLYWLDTTATEPPLYWCESTVNQIRVVPTPDSAYAYTIRGIARPDGLSSTATTTFLSTRCGDALFGACMLEAARFLKWSAEEVALAQANYYQTLLPAALLELKGLTRVEYEKTVAQPKPLEKRG